MPPHRPRSTARRSAKAPVGADTFAISLYSGQNGTGNVLSTGSLTQTIVVTTTNNVNVTFNGVPASIAVSGIPSGTLGTASAQAFTDAVKDAGGNTIVGTYANPVTLTNSDTSGATSVTTSGSDTPPAATLLSSSDVATLNFTGAALASTTIGASANGAGTASATFMPAPALTSIGVTTTTCDRSVAGHIAERPRAYSHAQGLAYKLDRAAVPL